MEAKEKSLSLAIVADDLTGACDTAVAFTGVSPLVRAEIEAISHTLTPIWAVSSNSRNLKPAEAQERVRKLLKKVPVETQVFKKVDSVFRGNTLEEICATLESADYDIAILAPAHPHLGRRVVGGMLLVRDLTGERTFPIGRPLEAMGHASRELAPGLSVEVAMAKMVRALQDGDRLMLCDAVDPEDLRTAVRAARSIGVRVLWIGSGGLARALAEEFPSQVPGRDQIDHKGGVLFFIGSNHPVTRAQVLHLQRIYGMKLDTNGQTDGHRLFMVPYGQSKAEMKRMVEGISPKDIGCLFLTGGDTAHLVCRALGITSLVLQWEFSAGVPLAIAEGGAFDGVPVVLKSGAFGGRGVLRDVLETFELRKAVAV